MQPEGLQTDGCLIHRFIFFNMYIEVFLKKLRKHQNMKECHWPEHTELL